MPKDTKKKRISITGNWSIRIRKIRGIPRKVKVRKRKGKIQTRVFEDKRKKPVKKIAFDDAYWNFHNRSFRSKVLDIQKKAKTVFKKDNIPEKYISKEGFSSYDVKGIDDKPKEYDVPKGLKKRRKTKQVYGHTIKGTYFYDHGELVHNTHLPSFKQIIRDKKIKTSKFGKDQAVSLSVDPDFSQMGNVSLVFYKNKLKNIKPVSYYDKNIYSEVINKSIPEEISDKNEHLRIKKGVYTDTFYGEREWISPEPIKITKKNLKKIVYIRPTYCSDQQYKEDKEEVQSYARQLGVPFQEKPRKKL